MAMRSPTRLRSSPTRRSAIDGSKPFPGTIFTTEEGVPFVVTELSGPVASIDFNHPLAGKHLIIDVKILNVESTIQEGMSMDDRRDITI